LVTVAAAICLAIGILGSALNTSVNPVYTETYVEALDNAESPESLAYVDVMPAEYRRE
jgi:hypothetical protein